MSFSKYQRGFSLIEVAVALFIIALLLGSIMVPLGTQIETRQYDDTQRLLGRVREALIGFAIENGYLPCPDKNAGVGGAGTANDGIEDWDGTASACSATSQGNVPWVTLGIGASDVWGNRLRYQVSANFARRPAAFGLTFSNQATVNICTLQGCPTGSRLVDTNPNAAVAVIISLGKNGYSAINANTGTANPNPPAANTEEQENVTGPATFASRTRTTADSAAGEFDDVVVWISKPVLFNRMVAAGRLP